LKYPSKPRCKHVERQRKKLIEFFFCTAALSDRLRLVGRRFGRSFDLGYYQNGPAAFSACSGPALDPADVIEHAQSPSRMALPA